MKIRRFYGRNVRVALKEVTEAFGEDAAILSNKKVPGGVEIIAALDYDEALMPKRTSDIKNHNSIEDLAPELNQSGADMQEQVESRPKDVTDSVKLDEDSISFSAGLSNFLNKHNGQNASINSNIQVKSAGLSNEVTQAQIVNEASKPSALSQMIADNKVEWSMDPSLQAMREELELMRGMMQEQLKGLGWSRFAEKSPLSAMLMRRLSSLGLSEQVIGLILSRVHYGEKPDTECVWQQALAHLAKSIPIGAESLVENGGIFALMGPTGVGKTTTIAKLAARFIIKHGADSVALITTDNYRISAFEQLSTFGKILRIPTTKVSDAESLSDLIKKYSNRKLVLIDTAGVSANDPAIFKQFAGIREMGGRIKPILLMSAASQSAVIRQSINLFSKFEPQGAIITKLDEAACLGEVLSILIDNRLPIVFTTDGQRIPEDIRVARSHHLVSKAVWLANKYQREVDDWELSKNLDKIKTA